MHYIALDRTRKRTLNSTPKIAFHDTNFPASLMQLYARLTKTAVKDRSRIKYDDSIVQQFKVSMKEEETYDRIYFPFYIDKQHWVGICLDLSTCTVQVLDCNAGFRTDSQIKKDINPITIVVPHILNSMSRQVMTIAPKPFVLSRVSGIPQNPDSTNSAVMTVRFIQAHASNGLEGCKEVIEASLTAAAKHLAVLVYRDITPV